MHGLVLCTFDQKESPSFWWWWWCICPPSFSSSVAVTWPALGGGRWKLKRARPVSAKRCSRDK